MDEIIDAWLNTYRAAGRSGGTVRARQSYVRTMARSIDPLTLTPDELNAYLASRFALSPEARKSMVVALRSFYSWAYRRGLTEIDLSHELPAVTIPRGTPKPISESALLRARAMASPETRLMLDLASRAGLRRSEIAKVHSDDVNDLGIVVHGKGGVERFVPTHPALRVRMADVEGWAFPSPRRPGMPVGPDYVSSRMEAVLPRPFTCHSLRHYFATTAYRGTHNLRAVQELLGHRSPETTQRYVLTDLDALTDAVRAVA